PTASTGSGWNVPATATSRSGSSGPRSDRAGRMEPARIAAALDQAIARELPPALPGQRWFGAKGRAITGASLRDCAELAPNAWLVLIDVTFAQGPDETYAVPLAIDTDSSPITSALALTLDLDDARARALDAFDRPEFSLALLTGFERASTA